MHRPYKSENGFVVSVKDDRDKLLTEFGKSTLKDRYLLENESYQDIFARVSCAYANNGEHAQRLYDYMSSLWFMPATPILSNGGTKRGLPISCYTLEVDDSLESIVAHWNESVWLASRGGGLGINWSNLRGIGEKVNRNGRTSGIIPFIKVSDSLTLAISQGSNRRGAAAMYLDISHPEIEEFLEMRRPTGGDPNRKAPNLHHGVCVTNAFMRAVEDDTLWSLVSPKDGSETARISARNLWIKLLQTRMETGEPYILFIDKVNENKPLSQKFANLRIKTSNLCSEITLPTGKDHLGNERTGVCCLSSLNLEYWDEWHSDPLFYEDVFFFLDNVLSDFIARAPDEMARARYSAMRERSIGLGVMGFHSFLQNRMVPFESVIAKVWNRKIFKKIKEEADRISRKLAEIRGACPDAEEFGIMERFSNKLAIAPTASISIIAGNTSPGIDPIVANVFLQKTLSGSFKVKNASLERLLEEKGMNTEEVWSHITINNGSVQDLDFLSDNEKYVFRTAFEIDQDWVVEHAGDRSPFVCQSQSVNLFFPGNVEKRELNKVHLNAWKKGLKSLYYCRSMSVQRPDAPSAKSQTIQGGGAVKKYEECLACQ